MENLSPLMKLAILIAFLMSVSNVELAQAQEDPNLPAPISKSLRPDDDDLPIVGAPITESPVLATTASPAPLATNSPLDNLKALPATPSASPTRINADPFTLQIQIAESALASNNSLTTLARAVTLYERALAFACPAKKSRCDEVTARLLELDAGNVPANCQKFGIRSIECKEVTSLQEIGWYEIDAARWRTVIGNDGGKLESSDLGAAIESKRTKPIADKLTAQLQALLKLTKRETLQEQALEKTLLDGIAVTCTNPKLVFLQHAGAQLGKLNESGGSLSSLLPPDESNDSSPTPSPTRSTTSPLDSVLQGLKALPSRVAVVTPSPTPASRITTPIEERLRRVRLLSRECYDFVKVAISLKPGLIQARCAMDGWYSPACKGAALSNNGRDGIESF